MLLTALNVAGYHAQFYGPMTRWCSRKIFSVSFYLPRRSTLKFRYLFPSQSNPFLLCALRNTKRYIT